MVRPSLETNSHILFDNYLLKNCKFCFSFGSAGKKLKESVKITSSTTLWKPSLKNIQVNRFLEYDFKNDDEIMSDIYFKYIHTLLQLPTRVFHA